MGQYTATGHENAEGMACSGVRVERPVRHFKGENINMAVAVVALTFEYYGL